MFVQCLTLRAAASKDGLRIWRSLQTALSKRTASAMTPFSVSVIACMQGKCCCSQAPHVVSTTRHVTDITPAAKRYIQLVSIHFVTKSHKAMLCVQGVHDVEL